ncbi:MAG: hypothetical protein ACRCY8_06300, partial [Dermatophilaceae bacterium]
MSTSVVAPSAAPVARPRRRGRRAVAEVAAVAGALVSAIAFLVYAVDTGLPAADVARMTVGVLLTQVLPGALLWRTVRPRRGWLIEDVVMGFALGTVIAVPSQVLAGLTRATWLSAAVPLLLGLVLVVVPVTRRRILTAAQASLPWWWGPLVGVAAAPAALQLLTYFRDHRLVFPPGAWRVHEDAYLHLALASQLLHRGPTSWPTVRGEELGYHWFTHAWIAQTARVSSVELDAVLLRFMPAVMPALLVAAVAVGALRLSGRPIAGVIAAALAMAGAQVNVFGTLTIALPLTPLSPTAGLAVPTLVALVLVMALRWRGQMMSGAWTLVPVLAVIATGTKGSTSPLVVAGLVLAAAAMMFADRRLLRPVLVDLALVTGALGLTVLLVFRGSSAGLAFGLHDAALQTPVQVWLGNLPTASLRMMAIVVSVVAVLSRAACMFALPFARRSRTDPVTWLLIGAVLAGAGAVGAFSHPGRSQYYFAGTAVPLMGIGAALGMLELHRRFGGRTIARMALVAVVGAVALVTVPPAFEGVLRPGGYDQVWALLRWGALVVVVVAALGLLVGGTGVDRLRTSLATVALAVTMSGPLVLGHAAQNRADTTARPVRTDTVNAVTQQQIDAARWIREHSGVDDVVMTNRHCTTPREPRDGCDSRRWVVTAFSERQALVEGWTATPRATRVAPEGRDSITVDYWRPEILRLNDGFIAAPDDAAAAQLRRLGVRWVYVDKTRPYAPTLEPYAKQRFENDDAAVYDL